MISWLTLAAGWAFEIAAWFALVEGRFADTVKLCEAGLVRACVSNAGVQLTLQASSGYARMGDSRAGQMLAAGRDLLNLLPEPEHAEHHFVLTAISTSSTPRRSTPGLVPTTRRLKRMHAR